VPTDACTVPVLYTLRDGLDDQQLARLDGRVVIVEGFSWPADSWPLGVAVEYETLWVGKDPWLSAERVHVTLREPLRHEDVRPKQETVRVRGVLRVHPLTPTEQVAFRETGWWSWRVLARAWLSDGVLLPR
jgi:hypothetical protein